MDDRNASPRKRICLMTPGHVSSCPRIVKEADALQEAGYEVTLVAGRHFSPVDALDESILSTARWRCLRVRTNAGALVMARKWLGRFLRNLRGQHPCSGLAEALIAVSPALPELVRVAVSTRAEFFHAHCLPGLAVAALAARKTMKRYGFDAEDFHEQETRAIETNAFEASIVKKVLANFLPGAAVRTAAAPLIAAAYKESYGVEMTTVLNSFDAAVNDEAASPVREFSNAEPAILYWFSQTIGPGRGLEQMIDVIGRMKVPVRLQLRGFVGDAYRSDLGDKARQSRVALEFLPPADPAHMVKLAGEADIGLSLEIRTPGNRDLCLTNKLFAYVAAGIPQILSRTLAQEAFAAEIGKAGLLIDLDRPDESAQRLDEWLGSTSAMDMGCRAAREAQNRFGWAAQRPKLLALFEAAV